MVQQEVPRSAFSSQAVGAPGTAVWSSNTVAWGEERTGAEGGCSWCMGLGKRRGNQGVLVKGEKAFAES